MAALCFAVAASAPHAQERLLPLEVTVNGEKGGTWPLVQHRGVLHAPREALDEWRVRIRQEAQPVVVRGGAYWPLDAVAGYAAQLDAATQSVALRFAPEAFIATRLAHRLGVPTPDPVLPSAFLNYDLTATRAHPRGGAPSTDLGALLEAGASGAWGVLTSSHAGRHQAGGSAAGLASGWVRLETTFTRHMPGRQQTLRLGDAVTRPGLWGRSTYFGGVQWGSNFGLVPGFLAQPVPVFTGVSSAPSTVELYVDDVLRQVSRVPSGPFTIDGTAGLAGGGQARLVVRDVLGRETVLVQPFFTSAQLLAPGLADWSGELGVLRRDLGSRSAAYGTGFASGTWRHGWTDALTTEARAELTRGQQAAGGGLVAALPLRLLGKAAAVASRSDVAGAGHHWLLGLEWQDARTAAQVQLSGASAGFRELGAQARGLAPQRQLAASISHHWGAAGSVRLGVAHVQRGGEPALRTRSLHYTVRAGRGSLSVFASKASGGASGLSTGVTYTLPLSRDRQASVTTQSHGGVLDAYASATAVPPDNEGLGWRVLAGRLQERPQAEAGVELLGPHGRATAELSASRAQSAWRVGATGALVVAQGHAFATRRLDGGYALAEVKDQEGVAVGLAGLPPARTDAAGLALVPNLSAWQANPLRLDARDLPVSTEIASLEATAVPGWRSAVKVTFPVRAGRAALLRIVFDDGAPAPAGAVVRIAGDGETFVVARRGEAYVTGLRPDSRVRLEWQGQGCDLLVVLPPPARDDIPKLGPVACPGVAR